MTNTMLEIAGQTGALALFGAAVVLVAKLQDRLTRRQSPRHPFVQHSHCRPFRTEAK